jgi:soluble lytic murein transglycosylase-like protein
MKWWVFGIVIIGGAYMSFRKWTPPAAAAPYLPIIRNTELKHAMPENLLARLLYQESRYRPDIISGKTVSSAGALGIAQIVPKWHPTVNPLDPTASIMYAGQYLASLKAKFGTWALALMAYNWGQGNLSKWLKNQTLPVPAETQHYVAGITGDVPEAGAGAIV